MPAPKTFHPGTSVFRRDPLSYENSELYNVSQEFLLKVYELNLYDKFSTLKGADLLYACIAKVENIPLVTHDNDFEPYSGEVTLIRPRDLMREKGTVTIESENSIYSVGYEVTRGSRLDYVRLDTGQTTQCGALAPQRVARLLLQELIDSGLAQRMGLGCVKGMKDSKE